MARPRKSDTIPLATTLARMKGEIGSRAWVTREVLPLPTTLHMEFWFPGQPKAKGQGWAKLGKRGGKLTAYIAPDVSNKAHEDRIREMYLKQIEEKYPSYIPYLPVMNGVAQVTVYALMQAGEDSWWPGKHHEDTPDDESLGKLVKDALGGRQRDTPGVLYWDDCLTINTNVWKLLWDPTQMPRTGYPQQPGTLLCVSLYPLVRNPHLSPAGEFVCPKCKRDDFRGRRGLKQHMRTCIK